MGKILTISPDKCIGCRSCELICSFSKIQAFNPKSARISVLAFDDVAVSVPVMCMQCDEPSCMKVCPVSAIAKIPDGTVLIDDKKCIGCKMCISACPLGNISYSFQERKIVKCNLCDGEPKCAEFCPSGAIQFKEATPANLARKKMIAERFKELFGEVTE
ncbi:4Fe-4S dicluster domain-containing protein [Biomaibacter acetigenes]|uniref:4Fe-4S dicluster domain-containing protein n=1 Tax=Biomaibacter acetigenes TaxID=2316383 RepID=A0A3G2R4B5_9FIRM|nr:4Fe-4S dicluster domain-containing protein [Biomaibacter acetigenes]AYO29958.1 4Fe-4S dicluster domain-containing protein [Biomaibacter acetigenes]